MEKNKIYCEDCLEGMKKLEDNSKLLNRRFIGYENNPEYYQIALNRINNLIKTKNLFEF